jgi:hypothetical protein
MFVVGLAGLQSVVRLAEEFVEQVSLGLAVPASGGAAGVVVAARTLGVAHGGQRADRADRGQAAVLDVAVQHHGFLAAGAGDRGGHNTPVVIDHRDVVMAAGPIDSAIQAQGLITPLVGASPVPGEVERRPNPGIPRSVISVAVRDSNTPQDLVLSKSSRLGNNHQEVNPAAGSGNGISPPPDRICRQARRSFKSRRTTGKPQASPGSRPVRTDPRSPRPLNPSLLNPSLLND